MRGLRAALLFVICACDAGAASIHVEPAPRHAEAAPATASCKPEAPVGITVDARPKGGDTYDVVVRATPTRDAASLELQLVLPPGATSTNPRASFGASAAGATRELTATVRASRGSLAAVARVPVEGIAMSRTA